MKVYRLTMGLYSMGDIMDAISDIKKSIGYGRGGSIISMDWSDYTGRINLTAEVWATEDSDYLKEQKKEFDLDEGTVETKHVFRFDGIGEDEE